MTLEEMMVEKVEEIIRKYREGKVSLRATEQTIASEVMQMQRLRYKQERE
jgi:glutamate racemase